MNTRNVNSSKMIVLAFFIIVSIPTQIAEAQTSAIRNGSFEASESEIPNWYAVWSPPPDVRVVSGVAYHGNRSVRFVGPRAGRIIQPVTGLREGQRWRISAWVRGDVGNDASVSMIVYDRDIVDPFRVDSQAITPGPAWQELSVEYPVNEFKQFWIGLHYSGGTNGSVYFDHVTSIMVDPPFSLPGLNDFVITTLNAEGFGADPDLTVDGSEVAYTSTDLYSIAFSLPRDQRPGKATAQITTSDGRRYATWIDIVTGVTDQPDLLAGQRPVITEYPTDHIIGRSSHMTLRGFNFGRTGYDVEITMGGYPAEILEASTEQVTFVVPSDVEPGSNEIKVRNTLNDEEATVVVQCRPSPQPLVVSDTFPDHIPTDGSFTITGSNLLMVKDKGGLRLAGPSGEGAEALNYRIVNNHRIEAEVISPLSPGAYEVIAEVYGSEDGEGVTAGTITVSESESCGRISIKTDYSFPSGVYGGFGGSRVTLRVGAVPSGVLQLSVRKDSSSPWVLASLCETASGGLETAWALPYLGLSEPTRVEVSVQGCQGDPMPFNYLVWPGNPSISPTTAGYGDTLRLRVQDAVQYGRVIPTRVLFVSPSGKSVQIPTPGSGERICLENLRCAINVEPVSGEPRMHDLVFKLPDPGSGLPAGEALYISAAWEFAVCDGDGTKWELGTTPAVIFTVREEAFGLSITDPVPPTRTVQAGQTVCYKFRVQNHSSDGTATIDLGINYTSRNGVAAAFCDADCNDCKAPVAFPTMALDLAPNASSDRQLKFFTTSAAQTGPIQFRIRGVRRGGGTVLTPPSTDAAAVLNITPAPEVKFGLTMTPSSRIVNRGEVAEYTVTLSNLGPNVDALLRLAHPSDPDQLPALFNATYGFFRPNSAGSCSAAQYQCETVSGGNCVIARVRLQERQQPCNVSVRFFTTAMSVPPSRLISFKVKGQPPGGSFLTQTATTTLTVNRPLQPNFNIYLYGFPPRDGVAQGTPAIYPVYVSSIEGFRCPVQLSVLRNGVPLASTGPNPEVTFSRPWVIPSEFPTVSSTVTITSHYTYNNTGSIPLTFEASSLSSCDQGGAMTRATSTTLTVRRIYVPLVAQVAHGSWGIRLRTEIFVTNQTDGDVRLRVEVLGSNGVGVPVFNGRSLSDLITIPAGGTRSVVTTTPAGEGVVGWARAIIESASPPLSSISQIRASAQVRAYQPGSEIHFKSILEPRLFIPPMVEVPASRGTTRTGVATANPSNTPVSVDFTLLRRRAGTMDAFTPIPMCNVDSSVPTVLPANSHFARHVEEIFTRNSCSGFYDSGWEFKLRTSSAQSILATHINYTYVNETSSFLVNVDTVAWLGGLME